MKTKIFFILLLVVVYMPWLYSGSISGYDFIYQYPESLSSFSLLPSIFKDYTSLGQNAFLFAGIETYYQFTGAFLGQFFTWDVIVRFAWLLPFILFAVFSSYYLTRSFLGVFIYTANTYILMIVGGGQMGIALSYSLLPLSVKLSIDVLEKTAKHPLLGSEFFIHLRKILLAGIALGVVLALDIRLGYLTVAVIFLYGLFLLHTNHWKKKTQVTTVFLFLTVSCLIVNLFWLLPILLYGTGVEQYSQAYTSENSVNFFSFARIENAISLLHPNWPSNIFGKVAFMKPEFIVIPILAFLSLLFLKKRTSIVFFSVLSLIGAFLSKGSNDPFGIIYHFLFSHFPGFIMFRDPTKFYTLIALSYSLLIPFTISKLKDRYKKNKRVTFTGYILLAVILAIVSWAALTEKLNGMFRPYKLPVEYKQLYGFLSSQDNFYRTYWIPQFPRLGLTSAKHPAVVPYNYYQTTDIKEILATLQNPSTRKLLSETSVKYVILPYDYHQEIFLNDGKYEGALYEEVEDALDVVPWLVEVKRFGKIIVYQTRFYKPLFSINDSPLRSSRVSSTQYNIYITNGKSGQIMDFSFAYDPNWTAIIENKSYPLIKDGLTSSLRLPINGTYEIKLIYKPQRTANIGFVLGVVFISFVVFLHIAKFFKLKK